MHFYGPLFSDAWSTALDWFTSYSLASKTVFGCIFAFVGAIVTWRRGGTLVHVIWSMISVGLGALAIIGGMFVISVFYYAPYALLDSVASQTTQDTRTQQNQACDMRVTDLRRRINAAVDEIEARDWIGDTIHAVAEKETAEQERLKEHEKLETHQREHPEIPSFIIAADAANSDRKVEKTPRDLEQIRHELKAMLDSLRAPSAAP
jgi:hypothetical protein